MKAFALGRRSALVFSVLGLSAALSACGDKGDKVSLEPIAAGEECATGGTAVVVNGERLVACNDVPNPITIEAVVAGADGNPCVGNATKITYAQAEGEPVVSWSCNTLANEQYSPFAAAALESFTARMKLQAMTNHYDATCWALEAEVEPPALDFDRLLGTTVATINACAGDAMNLFDGFSEETTARLRCDSYDIRNYASCFEQAYRSASESEEGVCGDSAVDEAIDECMIPVFDGNAEYEACEAAEYSEASDIEYELFWDLFWSLTYSCNIPV